MDEPAHDLYLPDFEHDACGVGMMCRIDGVAEHSVIRQGLKILRRLDHRGAVGADPDTGDGAGILIQLPDAFFRRESLRLGFDLPAPGDYAVGMVFVGAQESQRARHRLAQTAANVGVDVLGWRPVPVEVAHVGRDANRNRPEVWQVFLGRPSGTERGPAFERLLFCVRRLVERSQDANRLYLPSLSSRTIVYKGMLTVDQLSRFYPDLTDPLLESAVALVHSRFSTNTLPRWNLAHPFRFVAHNGEINTLRGNANWMSAREGQLAPTGFGDHEDLFRGLLDRSGSDSQQFDQALELLLMTGRSLPHALMMLIPEAWEHDGAVSDARKAFYQYNACLMEPWDGPAAILFSDGRHAGGVLDRNGLRPGRYVITHDGYLVIGSEAGTLDLDAERVRVNGRLRPGHMLLVDLELGRLVEDSEIKTTLAEGHPYRDWVASQMAHVDNLPGVAPPGPGLPDDLIPLWRQFGYTQETLEVLLEPMGRLGKEPLGSMGRDIPIAVLSEQPRPLFDYFKQLFAQVTNPPLDAIREEVVTSLLVNLGATGDLFQDSPGNARRIRLDSPLLGADRFHALGATGRSATIRTLMRPRGGASGLSDALEAICREAAQAVRAGADILILSDNDAGHQAQPIPALLATGAVHHHLIREGLRLRCSLVVSSGEPREVHHIACLVGYGANAIHPWLALATVERLTQPESSVDPGLASVRLLHAFTNGILKVMSKMGISTVQSYCGAQVFEAIGLDQSVMDRAFVGTPSRIGGIGLDGIATTYGTFQRHAFGARVAFEAPLMEGGTHRWRRNGEHHVLRPLVVATIQEAVRTNNPDSYQAFARLVNDQSEHLGTLRGLLDFVPGSAVPITEVEPWTAIVTRFKSGAMSYGSLSGEAHATLARAMNSMGAKSNTGEGGEDPARSSPGNPENSRIKQVASGRFGVTIGYLASADEIQIKMAQGAKPGEGGQLPGNKVFPWIARTRHATPYVGLISPPPHHDIYSIEDLAQLIFDLRNANPRARVSVKLVSEAGVGTVAAGVAKARADVVLISGHDGGTGASPRNSILHAGLPWELGLAEAHQTLVRNGLRDRIVVECDGGLRTGRDVVMAALLGADEFGFATVPLIAMGCVMMRKCHLNTCPVGIATQDPALRSRFAGQPEHVVNYFHFVAQEVRQIMATLGIRYFDELVGRVDLLRQREAANKRAGLIDLSRLLARPQAANLTRGTVVAESPRRATSALAAATPPRGASQSPGHALAPKAPSPTGDVLGTLPLHDTLRGVTDLGFIAQATSAIDHKERVVLSADINNTHRALGTLLSHAIVRAHGPGGLPDDTITLNLRGTAGQSLAAFGVAGLTVRVTGQANDYLGKGLSGALVVVSPPANAGFRPHEQIVVGNVALYGATSGRLYVRGRAGERFAVRNSGATAVVEGVGDHACEYMTGGAVAILGPTGRNFAAGMSGGVAYVLDGTQDFRQGRCTPHGVDLESVHSEEDRRLLYGMIQSHLRWTGSSVARWILDNWEEARAEFVKVMPREYREALKRIARESAAIPTEHAA